MKRYVRNTINLLCAKILLTSVINANTVTEHNSVVILVRYDVAQIRTQQLVSIDISLGPTASVRASAEQLRNSKYINTSATNLATVKPILSGYNYASDMITTFPDNTMTYCVMES